MKRDLAGRGEVYVVDDDVLVRDTLTSVLSREGFKAVCVADGLSLLAEARRKVPVCIFLDLHIGDESGLDVLKELRANHYRGPIIMISGRGDISTAVEAIRHGAFDFMEKPLRGNDVLARLKGAIGAHLRERSHYLPARFPGRNRLTEREIEILEQCARGASSKQTGRVLGISPRTVEDHRANIMRKLGARSTLEMVRMVMSASNDETVGRLDLAQ